MTTGALIVTHNPAWFIAATKLMWGHSALGVSPSTDPHMTTGAVIVTHNSAAFIAAAVESCLRQNLEVVVVDNASTDDTLARLHPYPAVKIAANAHNAGFAGGVNQGIHLLTSEIALLLNPDAELLTSIEPASAACAEHGASAGLLVGQSNKPQTGFAVKRLPTPAALAFEVLGLNRLWPSNPVNRHYRSLDTDLIQPNVVEQPAGAFLLVRKDIWQRIGGFDEGFHPVWFDDVDFCKRLHDAGIAIQYVPASVARHEGGHSVGRMAHARRARYWYGSLIRYSVKHFGPSGRVLVCSAVMAAAVPRMLVAIALERSFGPVAVYADLVRIAGMHLLGGWKEKRKASSQN